MAISTRKQALSKKLSSPVSPVSPANGKTIVAVDKRYFRPTEVDTLLGDPSKARKNLGWEPKITFENLVKEMTLADLEEAKRDELCQRAGFQVFNHSE